MTGHSFEDDLARAAKVAGGAPLDEALAGLHNIAVAAGIFEDTCHAASIGEVADMIAAWCRARRGTDMRQAGRHLASLFEPDAARRALDTYRAVLAVVPVTPPSVKARDHQVRAAADDMAAHLDAALHDAGRGEPEPVPGHPPDAARHVPAWTDGDHPPGERM